MDKWAIILIVAVIIFILTYISLKNIGISVVCGAMAATLAFLAPYAIEYISSINIEEDIKEIKEEIKKEENKNHEENVSDKEYVNSEENISNENTNSVGEMEDEVDYSKCDEIMENMLNSLREKSLEDVMKYIKQLELSEVKMACSTSDDYTYKFKDNNMMVGLYYENDGYFLYYGEYVGEERSGRGIWIKFKIYENSIWEVYDTNWISDLPNGSCKHYWLIEDEILEVFKEGNVVDGLWDGEVKVNGGSKQEYISYYNNGLVEYYGEKFDEEVDIQFYATGKYANGGYAWTSNIEDTEGVNPFSFF